MRLAAVIPAAGSSTRMGDFGKKEFLMLNQKPVILHSLDAFYNSQKISKAVIACRSEDVEMLKSITEKSPLPADIVEGGETRQASVLNGLKALEYFSPDGVFIHDGARPWITPELIRQLAAVLETGNAVIPAEASTSAMKIIDDEGKIIQHLERKNTVGAQTPQVFPFKKLLEAHLQAEKENRFDFIDDAVLYGNYGGKVYTIPGPPENRKITYSHDIDL